MGRRERAVEQGWLSSQRRSVLAVGWAPLKGPAPLFPARAGHVLEALPRAGDSTRLHSLTDGVGVIRYLIVMIHTAIIMFQLLHCQYIDHTHRHRSRQPNFGSGEALLGGWSGQSGPWTALPASKAGEGMWAPFPSHHAARPTRRWRLAAATAKPVPAEQLAELMRCILHWYVFLGPS